MPVVGAAASEDDPAAVLDAYRDQGISSVDDIDVSAGRLALALLLAGAEPGHYGFSDGARTASSRRSSPSRTEGE